MESLVSVAPTDKSLSNRPRLGGAFASYVRHRGEPDGKTTEPSNISVSRQSIQNGGGNFYLNITRQAKCNNFFLHNLKVGESLWLLAGFTF